MDRYDIAWLIWCYQQGYSKPEDRAHLTNWMRKKEDDLHPTDITDRKALLEIADAIIEVAKAEQG